MTRQWSRLSLPSRPNHVHRWTPSPQPTFPRRLSQVPISQLGWWQLRTPVLPGDRATPRSCTIGYATDGERAPGTACCTCQPISRLGSPSPRQASCTHRKCMASQSICQTCWLVSRFAQRRSSPQQIRLLLVYSRSIPPLLGASASSTQQPTN